MRRIDRYWKRCGACLLAAVTLMLGQGTMQSYAMNAQVINSPDRIVVQDENKNTGNQNNTNTQTVTTKAEVAGFGEVSTPVTDSSSYFGKGRLTLLANHDTAAQQLAAIIETGEGGLIVVDGGWTDNTDYVLNQIKAKGGHVQAWLITHPDSDHVGALADILYKHAGEITIDGIYYSFLEDSWYAEKDANVASMVAYVKGAFAKISPSVLHGDIVAGQVINA